MAPKTRRIAIAAGTAALAFVAMLALGSYVMRAGEPGLLVGWERGLLNHSTLIAWWLTWGCYPYVLGPISIALLIVAWRVPAWRGRIIFSIVMLLLCWRGAAALQHLFMRPRRLDWVVRRETAFSYPSSHAAIATGFYALWAMLLATGGRGRFVRVTVPALLLTLTLAIFWARLCLGAHYITDLAGGALVAVAVVSAALAVVPVKVFGEPAGRR